MSLRVGMVAAGDRLPSLSQGLQEQFNGRVQLHHFQALHVPEEHRSVHVLEIFANGVDKWRGLTWLAEERGIAHEQIAAIGDEVNDLSMVRQAGCGIAMTNAVEPLRDVADHVTKRTPMTGSRMRCIG